MILGSRLYLRLNQRDSISACLPLRNILFVCPEILGWVCPWSCMQEIHPAKGEMKWGKLEQPNL